MAARKKREDRKDNKITEKKKVDKAKTKVKVEKVKVVKEKVKVLKGKKAK